MTVALPAQEPVIDRSFAAQPPACAYDFVSFRFGQSSYGQLGGQAVEALKSMNICLGEVQEWIKAEEKSRN